ncbi:phage tail tape measure protein [Escherichia coli]|uniref:Putative phage tail length tape measure protein n=2 Tax=Escherichia coli TaxID=562 RepID=A0A2Y8KF93_ECOLX|nr:phage tail tape measure protein [Escherichia coli]MDC7887103.1 phage tail tape measure protein [Escherichia coli]SQP89737.1 putative phage tail length tape measure protein [Escherichia coli]SRY48129.1 putative phage tail length tape measure protein [Escherichia coli]
MSEQTSRLAIIIDSTGAKNNADNLTSSLVKMTQAGETAANSAGKVTKATEDEKNALAKLKAAIDPVGAAIDTVGRRYSELKKYFDKGLIDKEEYEFLARKLNETTEELSGVAQAQREAEKAGKLAAAQQEAQAQAFQRMLDKIDPLAAALRNLDQQQDELNAALSSGKINGSQFDNYSRKIQETRRELTGEAQAEREAVKAHDEQVAALQRLIAQLDPVGTAFNRLTEQQKQLSEAKAKGMLSPEMYEELSGKLRAMRSELEATQSQLSKTGMSAKQTAFAMRMLPAQMTDIVVGLSTGQSPFMVLMQQGGQLKDMFGGIGPAIKGVGSYVLGLINPFTLAAAAVGVLGLAYYKGSQEQDEFNKSLILTGNQLGTTSGQLADIAQRAGDAADSTTGVAAAVLNQLVRSGKVASSSLEQVTTAIVKTSELTGISTDQLVNDFNEIAKDPVSAISKLNDQYHFLTLATYNQIKALQDEGNQQEAARIATEAYSSSMIQRTNQIKENLGYLETAWKAVADSAKWAWDSMLDIGREVSIDQKIQDVSSELERAQKSLAELERGQIANAGPYGAWKSDDLERQRKTVSLLKQRLSSLQSEKIAQDVLNSSITDYNKRQQEGIELRQKADAFSKQYQTREQQRASELAKLEKLKNQYSKEEYNNLVAQINERYKDPKLPKAKGYSDDAAQRMIDHLNQQNALLSSQAELTVKLSSSEQELVKWRQQIADLESRPSSKLTQDQKSLLLHREEITALMEKNVAIEKNNRLIKESAEIAAWRDSLQASIDNRQQGYDIQIAGYGLGDKNQQRQQELLRIEREYNNQRLQLERDYADKSRGMSDHVFQEKMQALNDALEREKEIVRQKNEQVDIQAGDWVSGASQGFNNWLDDTKDISEQIKSTTTQMFDGMTDALGDFVTTGKANFRSFATSVISDLSRIALKASITGIFDSISNSSSGGILGTIGSAISKFIPNAKGGVYESPSLSMYSNGIYDSPQFFAFAKGAGVFGEAGPEAIMPLTRTSDGSLGVRAINSKSGNGGGDITYAPVYQITIQNDGQNGEIGPQAIKALMGMVDQRVQGTLLNMRRDGGILSG